MSREELFKLKLPWPEVMAEAMKMAGSVIDGVEIEDAFGCYSVGFFVFKGKFVAITIDEGHWHLSASTDHPIGYYELKELRYKFLPNSMYFAQILPPREHFVNIHENCYHLWQLAPGSYPEYVSTEDIQSK